MKKTYIYIICIVILIVAIIWGKFYSYKLKKAELDEFNLQYEQFAEGEIYGTQIATIINNAVDNNESNYVEKEYKENNGQEYYFYVPNETNSIKIDIKITDNDTTYQMESLYQGKITNFVQFYNSVLFKCTNIEYNKAGRVSYMMFEQVSE